ncbi:putative trans-sialidase, Group V [Trypanosoma cruzi]|nr:putative trans-sialidase, Group V [Trypanosoma cruzi]
MLSRVAAVMAPRTHNRRCVTGSSGRRREGRESEPQRPNISRRVFTSAALLLVVMMCCGTGGTAQAAEPTSGQEPSPSPSFVWKDGKGGETVSSLYAPSLVEVNGKVFAVAEAQLKKDVETSVFTGIASQLLTKTADNQMEEVLKEAKDTQILEEGGSTEEEKKEVDVSRPTAVVNGDNIYMLVGKHSHEELAECKATTDRIKSGMLLVKGKVGEDGNKINWNDTGGVPCTLGGQQSFLKRLIGGGGSGVKMNDGTLVFPVEGLNELDGNKKTVSLIIYRATESWTLSKGMSDGGCSDPSVVEWKEKLMMMTACDDGRRRVYEIGDKGDSRTEALGTLSRVWGNKQKGEGGVGSGFITATIDNRNVMLVTLPVYSKEKENEKGVLHLWLTDNTHIVEIGPVSGEAEDVAASSLLYRSGNNNEELIALYEKKNGDGKKPSPGMVSVRLTAQLQRVKEVLATWREVDKRVSKLCPTSIAKEDTPTDNACNTVKITDGLVGFLSGNLSENTWKDEYLGVNATVNNEDGKVTSAGNGVAFQGAWAEWPVGKQGENQLYHFANHNFTLVATVSIDDEPKGDTSIPLMGAKMDGGDNGKTVLLGLSYNGGGKWILLCGGRENKEHSSTWEPRTTHQVTIVLQNEKQGSAYVDDTLVGNAQLDFKGIEGSKRISHFYIGGDGGSAGNQAGVSMTVSNVLLYNRPLTFEEIAGLAKNTITIPKPEGPKSSETFPRSPMVGGSDMEGTVTQSNSAGQLPLEKKPLKENIGGGAGGVSGAASVATTPSSDASPSVATVGGDTVQRNGSPQTPEVSASSGEDGDTAEGTDAQGEEGIHPPNRDINATALNSSNLGNVLQENNSDAGTMRGSGLLPSLLLLLGLWGLRLCEE